RRGRGRRAVVATTAEHTQQHDEPAHPAGRSTIVCASPVADQLWYRGSVQHLDLTGAVLDGRYRVIEPIAEGAMGVVYRAERIKLGRIVAVKILHASLPNELSSRRRFEIEAIAMAKLEHPHCVAVLDVGLH